MLTVLLSCPRVSSVKVAASINLLDNGTLKDDVRLELETS
jgi:hypothetical protein